MRILIIDIETHPGVSHYWSTYKTTLGPDMLITEPGVLCVAAKWLDEGKTMFFRMNSLDDKDEMLRAVYDLLDEADAVVHYNGESFDAPHLNREFFLRGWAPPSPYKHIDLLRTMQRKFKFAMNKLAWIGPVAVGASKESTGGMATWFGCMAGDEKAWKRMRKYNIQDVKVTEELYLKSLAWIDGHPSRQLYDGHANCPACGSDHKQRRGYAYTPQTKFVKFQCQDCGKYWRGTEAVDRIRSTEVR